MSRNIFRQYYDRNLNEKDDSILRLQNYDCSKKYNRTKITIVIFTIVIFTIENYDRNFYDRNSSTIVI